MEDTADYDDGPLDGEEVYPCKGCGEILEEGKAFELAGNRWHLNCFRCNTCGLLLDSDANLLLLGDGSLICNNCTYSCSACNNKIEDLAILTGDQAFCATCFRCRNCKRKIENLRYARTSQGIFCMSCHESLMARRRKKSKVANNAKIKREENSSSLVDKSLPALPPSASVASAFPTDRKSLDFVENEAPTELSPRPHQAIWSNDSSSRGSSRRPREHSTERNSSDEYNNDGIKLQAKTYRKNRHSAISQETDLNGAIDPESFFIPLALESSTALDEWQPGSSISSVKNNDAKILEKDYFMMSRPSSKTQNELEKSSQRSAPSTPYAQIQDRDRDTPKEETKQIMDSIWKAQTRGNELPSKATSISDDPLDLQHTKSLDTSSHNQTYYSRGHNFTLSEPSNGKNLASQINSLAGTDVQGINNSTLVLEDSPSAMHLRSSYATTNSDSFKSSSPSDKNITRKAIESRTKDNLETLSLSLSSVNSGAVNAKPEPEIGSGEATKLELKKDFPALNSRNSNKISLTNIPPGIDTSPSTSSSESPKSTLKGSSKIISGTSAPTESPISTLDDRSPSMRVLARPALPQYQLSSTFMSPRAPPLPPQSTTVMAATSALNKEINGSLSSPQGLPRWSQSEGDFTMDEDFARILGGDVADQSQSLLRRVSNAVRHAKNTNDAAVIARSTGHGRSASETTGRTMNSSRWTKSSKLDEAEVPSLELSGSPAPLSSQEEISLLRRQLRDSEQRIAQLEHQSSAERDLKNLNIKVQEKRKTVSNLESQSDIMFQQIEVLGKYIEEIKKADTAQDIEELENSAIQEFVRGLDDIKKKMVGTIELLYEERNRILEEKTQLLADRDRALLEFEQLSSKNAQLADMNNDLTHQIQGRIKSQSNSNEGSRVPLNGLGIYSHPSKNKSGLSMHLDDISLRPSTGTTLFSAVTSYPSNTETDTSLDPSAVLSSPHVVNIRKGQATKKTFNWKKGRQTVAKGVSKGIKGAFSATQQLQTNFPVQDQFKWSSHNNDGIGLPYNMTTPVVEASTLSSPVQMAPQYHTQGMTRNVSNDQKNQGGFGLFKKSISLPKPSSNGNIMASEKPSILFGSELGERADYERRQIPSVVTRCIEEVELRGMDVEGIYRKTGGNSQVKTIQEGFEKSGDFDISDPGLDITAVTSVLKQYLRKLPTPLLTFDVYDRILESSSIEETHERCLHLRDTFGMLPLRHRDCLEFLMFHLTRVALREKDNLMSPKNLAVVFAPTIMRDTILEREMTDMHVKNTVVQFIIENSNDIFGSS